MSRRKSERNSRKRSNAALRVAANLPSLILKIGISYLKFKRARKKGVKSFRKQLKNSGLSKDQIEGLTKQYEDMGRVRNYLRDTTGFLGGFGL
ncbi:MAG: hypothetical protein JSV43_02460 [Methanobacteriota archaeon]|nr:MAG: hypothetical protein JSV43_02460 [Euryarchaeota archaeon]